MYNHDQPNEIMGPIYSLLYTTPNSVNEFYLSTEKCKFDVLRDARFRAVYLLAFAVETEQSSFENCALRIALAVGGRPGAIVIKDRVIAKEGSGLVERRLREALELSGSDR
jgi:hypothetical protein